MNRKRHPRPPLRLLAVLAAFLAAACPPPCARAARETVDGIVWVYDADGGKAVLGACAVPRSAAGTLTVPERLGGFQVAGVGDYAFYGCSKIEEIVLPNGLEFIGEHAFEDCAELKRVELPDSVRSIGFYSFKDCTSLETVKLPRKLVAIGNYLFYGCTALREVDFPPGLETVGWSAFSHCTALESVKLPSHTERVEEAAFNACHSLREVELPQALERIRENAFCDCKVLESVVIPSGVEFVGAGAFAGSGLRRLVVKGKPEDEPYGDWGVPEGCEWLDGNGKPIPWQGEAAPQDGK